MAPIGFLLILSLLVLSIFLLNDIELTNGVRDGARAGAICGTQLFQAGTASKLPNGQECTTANLVTFVQSRISTIPGVIPTVTVDFSGGSGNSPTTCSPGQKIVVSASYQQPLFVPLVGLWLGDSGNSSVRTITADAEATCEQ